MGCALTGSTVALLRRSPVNQCGASTDYDFPTASHKLAALVLGIGIAEGALGGPGESQSTHTSVKGSALPQLLRMSRVVEEDAPSEPQPQARHHARRAQGPSDLRKRSINHPDTAGVSFIDLECHSAASDLQGRGCQACRSD
jgi:hypothetical protein